MSVTLLHVSDPHLTDNPVAVARLRQALELTSSRVPDATVVTGDIADHGRETEYRAFSAVMARHGRPWVAVPGNHDNPDTLRTVLQQDRCPTLDVGPVRVIGLDVTVPGENHGRLGPDIARLATAKATGADQVVLALHQPPVRTGHAYADTMLLTNPQALTALARRLPRVLAILCGHVHTALTSSLDGIPVLGAPGVASTLMLDPDHRPLTSPDWPPGIALHRIDDNGTITTTFHYGA